MKSNIVLYVFINVIQKYIDSTSQSIFENNLRTTCKYIYICNRYRTSVSSKVTSYSNIVLYVFINVIQTYIDSTSQSIFENNLRTTCKYIYICNRYRTSVSSKVTSYNR